MQSIDDLEKLTKDELLALWRKHHGKVPPPGRSDRLVRELAYRIQERAYGKLDKNTTVSLSRHMASFAQSIRQGVTARDVRIPVKVALEAGSVITRRWNDQSIKVQIIGTRQFKFDGRQFKSLSAIAKEITGQHVSGPLFFGLKEVNRG